MKKKPITCAEAGAKGGKKVFAERGNTYFADLANKRWNKNKAVVEA